MYGPTILFDKSTIQILTKDEATWFGHFFRPVIAPIFLMEALGDLAKDPKKGASGDKFVSSLVNKIDVLGSTVNVDHQDLVFDDLVTGQVEMGMRPCRGHAREVIDDEGNKGIFFEEGPEEQMMNEWRRGRFEEVERTLARQYRDAIKGIDLSHFPRSLQKAQRERFRSVRAVANHCTNFVDNMGGIRGFRLACEVFGLDDDQIRIVKESWDARGRPSLRQAAPYARYALIINLTFGLGLMTGVITTRPSNYVDLQYIYYLPFASTFTSGDEMQSKIALPFLSPHQTFAFSTLLKGGLAQLVAYFAERKDELTQQGRAAFRYPPLELPTVIHELWDRHLPGWRESANAPPPPPMSEDEKKRLLARLNKFDEAIRRSRDEGR